MLATATIPDSREELAHRLALSAVGQLLARSAHLILNIVTSILVVRYLDPAGYGDYAKVVIIVGWTSLLSDAGLPKVALRVAVRDDVRIDDVVGTVTLMRLALCVAGAGVTQAALSLVHATPTVRAAGGIACLMFVVEALLSTVLLFQVTLRQQYEGYIRVLMEFAELAALLIVIARHGGLIALFAAPIVGGSVGALLGWLATRRHFERRPSWNPDLARTLMMLSLPVLPGILLGALTLKLDGVMVAALGSTRDTGIYTAAFQPVEYVFLALGAVVAYPFLPVLARTRTTDPATFLATYRKATELVIVITLPVTVIATVSGTALVDAVYGPGWHDAVLPFQLLALALVFMAVSGWQGFVLLAGDRQIDSLRYGIAALVVSVVVCFVLVPHIGPVGGAVGALSANVVGMVASVQVVRRRMRVTPSASGVTRIIGAGVLLAAALLLLRVVSVPWWAGIVAAAPIYGLALWGCRVITIADIRKLLRPPSTANPAI